MWTVIIIIVVLLAFGFIRGTILSRTYKVVNKKGTTFHIGAYSECKSMAKTQNEYCKSFSIDDFFTVNDTNSNKLKILNMIWVIVFVTIAFVIIKFLLDWKKQNAKLVTEGGLRTKYSELIKLMQANSNPTVFQSDIDTYFFGWVTPNADNRFLIIQTFEFITIKWNFKGTIAFENKTINLSKEWKFPENTNQEEIAEKVLTEMTDIYNKSEFGNY